MSEILEFPVRLNRYMAIRGLATRRFADTLITSGLVLLNGKKAQLGDRVETIHDTVEVLKTTKNKQKARTYVAYCKPQGVITHSPQFGEASITEISGFPGLFPVGRLDKASEGLILLTNDGRVTDRLLHPRFAHEKEYIVTVREKILPSAKHIMERGIQSDNEILTAKKVEIIGVHTMRIVLTEGKKHQIRRMSDALHLTVEKLVRVRIMGIHLGSLKPGQSRVLKGTARISFLKSLDLPEAM
ncbi:MAG: pseudouridine synthase [Minisyncoccota bacterium]